MLCRFNVKQCFECQIKNSILFDCACVKKETEGESKDTKNMFIYTCLSCVHAYIQVCVGGLIKCAACVCLSEC